MTAMPARLVIFDFDGTLADSYPWFVQALKELGSLNYSHEVD